MFQDSRGFMWIGTWDGLNRFDGYTFKTYKPGLNDSNSITGNYINSIVEDKTGNLWVGTNEALNRFDHNKQAFTRFQLPISGPDKKAEYKIIYIDNENRLWITCRKELIYVFDITSQVFAPLKYTKGLVEYNETTNHNKVYYNPVNFLYFVGRSGLTVVDVNKQSVVQSFKVPYTNKPTQEDELRSAYADTGHIVWIACRQGLLKMNTSLNSWQLFNKQAGNGATNGLVAITPYDSVQLWTGSFGFGVHLFNKRLEQFVLHLKKDVHIPESLSENIVEEIYRDRSGNHWFGVQPSGLNMYNPGLQQFKTISLHSDVQVGAQNNSAQGITSAGKNTVLISFYQSGLLKHNLVTGAQKAISLPGSEKEITAQTCYTDDHGTVWTGTDYGLYYSTDSAETFRHLTIPRHFDFYDMFTFCSIEPGIFFTGNSQGLFTVNYQQGKPVISKKPVLSDTIITMTKLQDRQYIYANNKNELVVFEWDRNEANIIRKYPMPLFIRHIEVEKKTTVWLSTSAGIIIKNLYDDKETILDESKGLSNNYVYATLLGKDGNMWASTNDGINKISTTSYNIDHFNLSAGVQGKEFNTGSFFRSTDGGLFFGGTNGANYFDPKEITIPHFDVPLQLMVSTVNDQEQQTAAFLQKEPVQLAFNKNNLFFSFTAIDFNRADNIVYSYKINDAQWISIGNERTLRLLNLAPGEYVIHIKAGLKSGLESNTQLIIRFGILAPWYRTLTSTVLFGCLTAFLIYVIIRIILANKIKQQRILFEKQEAVIQERERIISDLHDDVGGGLSAIRMMSDLMLKQGETNQVSGVTNNNGFAQKISATAREIAQRMHIIIWSLNAENDTLGNFCEYVRQYGISFFEDAGIEFTYEAANGLPSLQALNGIQRKNLFLITKEAFHNILKHSHAGNVKVDMYMKQQSLYIDLKDDGCGLTIVNQFGNGLKNMQKRMEEINGEIHFKSESGTTVQLILPFATTANN